MYIAACFMICTRFKAIKFIFVILQRHAVCRKTINLLSLHVKSPDRNLFLNSSIFSWHFLWITVNVQRVREWNKVLVAFVRCYTSASFVFLEIRFRLVITYLTFRKNPSKRMPLIDLDKYSCKLGCFDCHMTSCVRKLIVCYWSSIFKCYLEYRHVVMSLQNL